MGSILIFKTIIWKYKLTADNNKEKKKGAFLFI